MRWVLSLLLALAAGVGVLYGLTDGFTVLTAEDARRQAVAAQPRRLPDVLVQDQQGDIRPLAGALRADGRVAIVNFFYTRCLALCLAQGSLTERLQRAIVAEGLQDRVRLISISFDPRDQRAGDLSRYAARMQADPAIWQFMAFTQAQQRDALLAQFGITVIPAPLGEFEHNAAFHIVTPDARLVRIFDLDDPGLALKAAAEAAAPSAARQQGGAPRAGAAAGAGAPGAAAGGRP